MTDLTVNPPEHPAPPPKKSWWRPGTPAAKIVAILGLLLMMQVPLAMVSGLINERAGRQQEVLSTFRHGWGPEQSVAGPLLVVPYTYETQNSVNSTSQLAGWLRIAPTRSLISAVLKPEIRRRGLFRATVYSAAVTMSGSFTLATPDLKDVAALKIDWNAARIVLGASDLRGLPADTQLDWNGTSIPLGTADIQNACGLEMMSMPARLVADSASLPKAVESPGKPIPFKLMLTLRGTQAFHVVPFGQQLYLGVTSSWPSPGFVGGTLPLTYQQDRSGFAAHWEYSGGSDLAIWQPGDGGLPNCQSGSDATRFASDAQIGVELQEAVPTYLMVSRAEKYGVLFLTLSFLTLFLFEIVSRVRVHLVQYGLLGLSVSLFALLLISIAEPIGFSAAYAVSTAAILLQASLYTLSVVRRVQLAAIFAGVLGSLFGFLFIVLSLDAYALLAGTVALFTILSGVMFATRKVDWAEAAG